ncbi:YfbM family protein [Funiculus sociatus GB2-A5]|uniref:YfbM family protein n=1 Tax=Funiculus sociatus GB2-A5 TaxID=2933946 RepID=A0ABV0JWC6_9CYAN|nr:MULTISPECIES: DUF1877 family protein [unclassified Trichocoleus]MBD1905047.1 DUF1877 family protein [Trichocoleus sp. FACHB-832]MBD2062581.1 DUF1877 family protein [Trichocoleus sp. FACHB-6]
MSTAIALSQVSSKVLEKLEENPYAYDVFFEAITISDPNDWQEFKFVFYQQDFDEFKADAPRLLAEGKNRRLYLGENWQPIQFYLTATCGEEDLIFPNSYSKDENDLLRVNAVTSVNYLKYERYIRYFTADEVKDVVEELSRVAQEDDTERLRKICRKAKVNFWEREYENWIEYTELFNELIDYYKDAADKGNAMLISIG